MKKALYLLIFITIILIVPFLLPNQLKYEKSITINASQEEAYAYLVNLQNWKEWNPWLEKEPSAEFVFVGIPGVVGSQAEWSGKMIGTGRQTLTKLREPEYIESHLEFIEPRPSTGTGYIKIINLDKQIKITWGMQTPLPYPIGRVMGLFIPSMLDADFSKGLQNLKNQLEKSP